MIRRTTLLLKAECDALRVLEHAHGEGLMLALEAHGRDELAYAVLRFGLVGT